MLAQVQGPGKNEHEYEHNHNSGAACPVLKGLMSADTAFVALALPLTDVHRSHGENLGVG